MAMGLPRQVAVIPAILVCVAVGVIVEKAPISRCVKKATP